MYRYVYKSCNSWNSTEEKQCDGRVHRQGQEHEVEIRRYMICDSMDEYMEETKKRKDETEKAFKKGKTIKLTKQ
jgi:SNF2 family DNA or RNA helicase